jgi:hypothetical protein
MKHIHKIKKGLKFINELEGLFYDENEKMYYTKTNRFKVKEKPNGSLYIYFKRKFVYMQKLKDNSIPISNFKIETTSKIVFS